MIFPFAMLVAVILPKTSMQHLTEMLLGESDSSPKISMHREKQRDLRFFKPSQPSFNIAITLGQKQLCKMLIQPRATSHLSHQSITLRSERNRETFASSNLLNPASTSPLHSVKSNCAKCSFNPVRRLISATSPSPSDLRETERPSLLQTFSTQLQHRHYTRSKATVQNAHSTPCDVSSQPPVHHPPQPKHPVQNKALTPTDPIRRHIEHPDSWV